MARTPNVVASVVAFEGAGKTRFWTTAPSPIAAISTDTNTEDSVRLALKIDDDDDLGDHGIHLKQISMPTLVFDDDDRDEIKDSAASAWEDARDFLKPFIKGDEDDRARTLVFDTAPDVYDLLVFSIFGKKDQIAPEQRRNFMGRANTAYKGIIQAAKDRGLNVILVHRAKEKWIDAEVETQRGTEEVRRRLTGSFDMEREGFKGTGFITSLELHLAFDPERDGKLSAKYGVRIARCTHRPGIIGREYWGRQKTADGSRIHAASFPFVMTQVFPRTSIEDWR